MTDNWAEWEGRTVDGKYLLRNYLGGADSIAVFRTRLDDEVTDAAIKLIATEDAGAEGQLLRWETASELSHRHLIRILAAGHAVIDDREAFYAVEELAEENLGQIVPERPLTADEARSMLGPVLSALQYLHGKGLVHGRIRPANILAVGDQVKLSSDSLREAGEVPRAASAYDAPEVAAHGVSAASDVWALGMTLAEVMTQHVPVWDAARMSATEVEKGIPEPIGGIVSRCLEIDPQKRCGLGEICERLDGAVASRVLMPASVPPAEVAKGSAGWSYWIAGIAAFGVAILLIAHPWSTEKPVSKEVAVQSQPTPAQTSPLPAAPAQSEAAQPASTQPSVMPGGAAAAKPSAGGTTAAPKAAEDASSETGKAPPKDGIVLRAMPEVSASARRTIEGRIRVRAKVDVDADGNVNQARLTDAGPSKYFARVALEGARRWKFAPARDEGEKRQWTLQFVFTRARTEATATQARGN